MFTITASSILPCTVTGSWPRPRWFDLSMWGRPLDTCMMDVRFREKFQDALATVLSDQERAGLDILTHGDLHCDDDMAGRSWHHYPLQRWAGFSGDFLQSEATRSPWLRYPPGTLLNEIYTGWRWPRVTDKIEHRPLDYAKIWRMAQSKTVQPGPLRHLLLAGDGAVPRSPHAEIQGQAGSDLGHGGGDEQRAAGPARRRLQVHPNRGADAPLLVQHLRPRPRQREVHAQGLQPRSAGPGRCRNLDSHLLGQPEHAARDRKRQLPRILPALPRSVPRETCGPSRPRTGICARSSCSRRSRAS